ncbi:MAG: 23S rRNA (adenine(2503)-C(2))-methyltransferase RlmN [Lachnospiraceae bacterium]|nr:23S rRNA (adenine(2503)-C(2))-methyltransferase RlmN [Lachnospiraceae bacterium]
MFDILSADREALTALTAALGEKKFRAEQLFRWLHVQCVSAYDEMGNLPQEFRRKLAEEAPLRRAAIETVQESRLDGTRKYLFRLADDSFIESVLMRYEYGISVCVSSQVGCRMGCRFCASTLDGLSRNLTAGEILDQVEQISRDTGERVSHVVVMGTGEPFDNYDSLVRFIRLLTDEKGQNLSQRNITVSTCGIVPRIYQFAKEGLAVNLALSLHAPNDAMRRELMPIANRYSLDEILPAMKAYFAATGRRLTYEYSLCKGVNDGDEAAEALGRLLRGQNALVNLIPVNPVTERGFVDPSGSETALFKKKLEKNGLHVTIRREMGRDIDGACGQLRKRFMT